MKLNQFLFLIFVTFSTSYFYGQQRSGTVTINIDNDVEKMIELKKNYNKTIKTYKGFKIQLFFGSEKQSYEVRDKFKALYPDIDAKIIFSTPDWKVQAGKYFTKLDADRHLNQIKQDFPGALVLETDIIINEKI